MRLLSIRGWAVAACLALCAPAIAAAAPLEVGAARAVISATDVAYPLDLVAVAPVEVRLTRAVQRDHREAQTLRQRADIVKLNNAAALAVALSPKSPLEVGSRLAGSVRASN